MTTEQYTKACKIYEKLKLLKETLRKIESTDYRLNYSLRAPFGKDFDLLNEYERDAIWQILDKYEGAILKDIKAEIEYLEKEISEL